MTQLSKRLEQTIKQGLSKNILPVKTEQGILVGDVLIVSEGQIKHLQQRGAFIYKNISLNLVAIKLANKLALHRRTIDMDKLWSADQEYGKWYIDSQMLRAMHQKALNTQDFDRADMLWARYSESRDRALTAKKHVDRLASFE